jgi:hypothetical protein
MHVMTRFVLRTMPRTMPDMKHVDSATEVDMPLLVKTVHKELPGSAGAAGHQLLPWRISEWMNTRILRINELTV